eukprot:8389204-Pyramimonas_sp.AAC.1
MHLPQLTVVVVLVIILVVVVRVEVLVVVVTTAAAAVVMAAAMGLVVHRGGPHQRVVRAPAEYTTSTDQSQSLNRNILRLGAESDSDSAPAVFGVELNSPVVERRNKGLMAASSPNVDLVVRAQARR